MWKPVNNYEGYYEVSNSGEVRSVDRICIDPNIGERHLRGRLMKLTVSRNGKRNDSNGYLVVNLHKNHKSQVAMVHRLVADAFLDNPNNYPTVNHIDGNKQNNNVSNLEWASYSMNNTHALRNGLREARGIAIVQKNMNGEIIGHYRSACEASRTTGIGRGIISHCVNGRVKTAGGFLWEKIKCNDYLIDESTPGDELPVEAQEPHNAEDIVCANGNI